MDMQADQWDVNGDELADIQAGVDDYNALFGSDAHFTPLNEWWNSVADVGGLWDNNRTNGSTSYLPISDDPSGDAGQPALQDDDLPEDHQYQEWFSDQHTEVELYQPNSQPSPPQEQPEQIHEQRNLEDYSHSWAVPSAQYVRNPSLVAAGHSPMGQGLETLEPFDYTDPSPDLANQPIRAVTVPSVPQEDDTSKGNEGTRKNLSGIGIRLGRFVRETLSKDPAANTSRRKQPRIPATAKRILEEHFARNPYPSSSEIKEISAETGEEVGRIQNWFSNARTRKPAPGMLDRFTRSVALTNLLCRRRSHQGFDWAGYITGNPPNAVEPFGSATSP
jgi:hypothetical protein